MGETEVIYKHISEWAVQRVQYLFSQNHIYPNEYKSVALLELKVRLEVSEANCNAWLDLYHKNELITAYSVAMKTLDILKGHVTVDATKGIQVNFP